MMTEEDDNEGSLAYSTLLRVVRAKEPYTGKLYHRGEVVNEDDCPALISEERFQELQEVLTDPEQSAETDDEADHVVDRVVEELGIDATLQIFGDVLQLRCPQCEGELREHGSETINGHRVQRYICENHQSLDAGSADSENDCTFRQPLLTGKFLREWDGVIPLTCPLCRVWIPDARWDDDPAQPNLIETWCSNCRHYVAVSASADKYKRMMDGDEGTINFFPDIESADEDEESR